MSKAIIISQALDVLPFHEILSWERFQIFCTDVLSQKLGVTDCREYLVQGNAQEGIDIYATEKETDKKLVAQCKLEKYLSPKDIEDLIEIFLSGKFAQNVTEFYLCTSFDLSRHRSDMAIENGREKLKANNIDFVVWDKQGLSRYLRINPLPQIVYHYFKEDVAKAFYGEIWNDYINFLKIIPKREYKYSEDYIERSIVPYIEYQKTKNNSIWHFTEEKKEKTIINLFEDSTASPGKKVILLSVAGFGKTEELNRLAAFYSSDKRPIHPIRFLLKDYEGQSIETQLNNYNINWKNISGSNILLLFDGLDEIKEQQLQTFINHLNSFLENNPDTNVLVTSRFNFYDLKHQSLREFDIYILRSLSESDIQKYIVTKLGLNESAFKQKLQENKFSEYINNPYYLTRLVRFYNDRSHPFPKNKSDLFSKILFEQLEKDELKFNVTELKERLLPIARKISFCMTLAGKSSLTTDELKIIIPENNIRKELRHVCILNLNESANGSWSFEHKNLQEYLCASQISETSFESIHNFISFSFNRKKLLPRFLNTISFLFEILDKKDALFNDLFDWIQSHQPELFVRFEKEIIEKTKRQEIFKIILDYYKKRNITIRISSNFYIEELSQFADIDRNLIDFMGTELNVCDNEHAYDLLQLLSTIKKAFLYKEKLIDIYFSVLNSETYATYVKGQCIYSLFGLASNDKGIFERLLQSNINVEDFEIRKKLISLLEYTSYYEDFADFILASIPIYQNVQMRTTMDIANEGLVRLILKFNSASSIKKILQLCISHKQTITDRPLYMGIQFNQEQFKQLLEKAAALYEKDKSFVRLVYRIFVDDVDVRYDDKLIPVFKEYFTNTCGADIIFNKLYIYDWKRRHLLHFANEKCLDFLVDEFLKSKLTDKDVIIIRNRLSWLSQKLMNYFLTKLNEATDNKFKLEEDELDRQQLYENYLEKNKVLLLNRTLFIKEAKNIFKAIGKAKVEHNDFFTSENNRLRAYQFSIVTDAIKYSCIHTHIKRNEFIDMFSDDKYWEGYVIEEIYENLKNKKNLTLTPELLQFAENWLTANLKTTDFTIAISDNPDGGFRYNTQIEFIKHLYLLLDVELPDHLLLKLLETDFSGFQSQAELLGVSGKISKNIKDRSLFKNKVIENIKSGYLSSWVLATHFSLSYKFKYSECAGEIYASITSDSRFDDQERRTLTNYYLELGGEISDFSDYLQVPVSVQEEDYLVQWEWYLLDKFITVEPDKVAAILLNICNDSARGNQGKAHAISMLLKMGRKEGFKLWIKYIHSNHESPFMYDKNNFQEFIDVNPIPEIVEDLIGVLDYSFLNKIFADRSSKSIQEFIYSLFYFISLKSHDAYTLIKQKCEKLADKYSEENFGQDIVIFLEKLDQRFYENQEYEISIPKTLKIYIDLYEVDKKI
jgi:hypothetical protein